ncbi:hypothetical protein D9757_008093 [Collybiopsis confluens]|uniref:MMS19 nucleotide excision repair protein n=1 Tax=Collybiopsis confluens TaxID=2823264 RepID=A0A8H5M1W4_9AGAR|nr:hypothetical protein D9757_008093 [Collybiopsis confluens]
MSAERLVRTWITSQRAEEVTEIVSGMLSRLSSPSLIINTNRNFQRLNRSPRCRQSPWRVSDRRRRLSANKRSRFTCVELLSAVLSRCPADKLNRQAAKVLTTFYCSKMEDTETVVPALKGLASLTKLPSSTSEDVPNILDAIFEHVKMKGLVQSVRFQVFTIIDTLLARHRDAFKTINDSFLGRYIALVEGEKDPRNLLLAFAIARVLLIEFDITNFFESLFNITFCYFPITFRPPPNDPYGISTDDLRQALRGCLNATPSFGPLAIPVFLEKLAAGSPTTKRDTLQSMSLCFPVYGSALARSHARQLWNALKLEIFQPTDPITEEFALKTTQSLIKTIYAEQSPEFGNGDIEGLARDACEECISILREPEKSQAKPAIKVLCAFMSTTPSVARYTVAQTVPYLVKLYTKTDNIASRPSILLLLSELIAASRDSMKNLHISDASEKPLGPFKDEILGILTSALKTPPSRDPALACLLGFVSTGGLLTDEELAFIVHGVDDILSEESEEGEEASAPALKLLVTISLTASHHVKEQTLPLLFGMLSDNAPPRDAAIERAKAWRILSALNTLCRRPDLFETLVISLNTKLDLLCMPSDTPAPEELEPRAAYAHSILTTLHQTILAKVDDGHVDVAKYIESLVPRLFNLFIYSALDPDKNMIASDPRLITEAGNIIGAITQTVSAQRQQKFVQTLFNAYLDGNYKDIADGPQKIPLSTVFAPLNPAAPKKQRNLVILMASAVLPLHKEIRIPVPDLSGFFKSLVSWGLADAGTDLQQESAWKMLCAIVNKRSADASTFIKFMLEDFGPQSIANRSCPPEKRNPAIRVWIWVSKALLVCNHTDGSQFTELLFQVFDDEAIKWSAATSFGEIVRTDMVLTKHNYASIKMLYAQRFLRQILPRMITGAHDSTDPESQISHLIALTSLISSVPKALYIHDMPKLIPLLVRGLDLPDHNIRYQVINTFLSVAEGDSADIVSEHAPTLIQTMLRNSTAANMSSARVRISALKYLGVLPTIVRYDILHPHKATVIRQLAVSLDDPKRTVRKEAVAARTTWFKSSG